MILTPTADGRLKISNVLRDSTEAAHRLDDLGDSQVLRRWIAGRPAIAGAFAVVGRDVDYC